MPGFHLGARLLQCADAFLDAGSLPTSTSDSTGEGAGTGRFETKRLRQVCDSQLASFSETVASDVHDRLRTACKEWLLRRYETWLEAVDAWAATRLCEHRRADRTPIASRTARAAAVLLLDAFASEDDFVATSAHRVSAHCLAMIRRVDLATQTWKEAVALLMHLCDASRDSNAWKAVCVQPGALDDVRRAVELVLFWTRSAEQQRSAVDPDAIETLSVCVQAEDFAAGDARCAHVYNVHPDTRRQLLRWWHAHYSARMRAILLECRKRLAVCPPAHAMVDELRRRTEQLCVTIRVDDSMRFCVEPHSSEALLLSALRAWSLPLQTVSLRSFFLTTIDQTLLRRQLHPTGSVPRSVLKCHLFRIGIDDFVARRTTNAPPSANESGPTESATEDIDAHLCSTADPACAFDCAPSSAELQVQFAFPVLRLETCETQTSFPSHLSASAHVGAIDLAMALLRTAERRLQTRQPCQSDMLIDADEVTTTLFGLRPDCSHTRSIGTQRSVHEMMRRFVDQLHVGDVTSVGGIASRFSTDVLARFVPVSEIRKTR